MRNFIEQSRTENKITHKNIGEYKMNSLSSQISDVTVFSNASKYFPMHHVHLRDIDFSNLSVGVEYPIYDSITDNHFTLAGKRISFKKEYETRVVIGCVECHEYMVIEDEELENLSCSEVVNKFLTLVNSRLSTMSRIAA